MIASTRDHETAVSNVTALPPVAVAGMTLFGFAISDWVQVLAAVWLIVQIVWFINKQIRDHKTKE